MKEGEVMLCASCGTAGSDDNKLKKCTACHLVRYCGVKCQKDHRPKHKRECKKRAAELRDEILFKLSESSYLGDCPICCLPLPIDGMKCVFMTCCSKFICDGCDYANEKREYEGRLQPKCLFCRKDTPNTEEEKNEQLMKRIEVNDALAMCHMGQRKGDEGDYKSAFEYFTNAAALGDKMAHYQLSVLYRTGQGVERDEERERHHLTEAAIGGNPLARHNLGQMEWKNGKMDRAAKHHIVASKLGVDHSLECVKNLYKAGLVNKEDFAAALRGHKAAVDATKSRHREDATKFEERLTGRG